MSQLKETLQQALDLINSTGKLSDEFERQTIAKLEYQLAECDKQAEPVAHSEPDAFVRVKSGKIVGQSVHDEMADGIYELRPWGAVKPAPAVAQGDSVMFEAGKPLDDKK